MNPEIIQWLTSHPEIDNVYLRADGSWAFEPRKDYDKVISRAEALGQQKESVEESTESKETKIKTPKKN